MAEYFLDPTVAADGGDGTIGNPWTRANGQVEQYVLDNEITRDTSIGDVLHIKSGTRHTNISGSIDLSFYGTPSGSAGLTFRGYTSAARDGGIADLNMGGNTLFLSTGYNHCHFVDCEIHNFGSGQAIRASSYLTFTNCHIHDCNGSSFAIQLNSYCFFNFCWIRDLGGGTTALVGSNCWFLNCFVDQGAQNTGLYLNGGGAGASSCIVKSDAFNCIGIRVNSSTTWVDGNTIYNGWGSYQNGIYIASAAYNCVIRNNYIEGWSGSGGDAIQLWTQQRNNILYGNRWYNCTNGISPSNTEYRIVDINNSSLPSSPFTNTLTLDFTISDALKAAATPSYIGGSHISSNPTYIDVGAVQRPEGAGGGLFRVNLNGGI